MNRGLNKVLLIGRLADVPQLRETPNNRSVTAFTLAAPRAWRSADGAQHEEMEWFNIVAWGSLAELCHEKLTEGRQIYIEGHLQTRNWVDQSGKRHFRTEVVMHELVLLDEENETT